MRRANTHWRPVTAASLHWSDTGDPVSTEFGDIYYSRHDGLEESRYVFLQGNHLPGRWSTHQRRHFCIGETGFGTGLNFLLTWQAWREQPEPRPELHYLSIEKSPLSQSDLARALSNWPSLQPLAKILLEHYPGLLPGQHRLLLDQGRVRLDLWWEDVADALPDLAGRGRKLVDAWYLDGFAPASNSAMWSSDILQAAAALSHPQASFATFTAAGQVRRDLADAGFAVRKVPGYGRKRECLRGQLTTLATAAPTTFNTSWDINTVHNKRPTSALVLGGGLAGCTVAAALARRGVAVKLLEQGKLAGAASGNDQGILYTRLSRKHSSLTDFALQSFRFAAGFYRSLLHNGQLQKGSDGDLCGSFHTTSNEEDMTALAQVLCGVPELAKVLSAEQARQMLGIEQPSAGYWYPQSGWLRPGAICSALVNTPGIELIENCGELALQADAGCWHAMAGRKALASADCAIVATGTGTTAMEQLEWLPLQAIRGQTTLLPTAPVFSSLRAALCHEGYIAPARGGSHCIGATFDVEDQDASVRSRDHGHNLDKLGTAVPAWRTTLASLDPAQLTGRVGYRCASPDYLPLVGPVPDVPAFLRDYGVLRKNARQRIAARGEYMHNLYLTTAHGSRGLTSTPLAGELLASMICAEPPPLSRELCRALAPARFIIRDLSRNRI